MTGPEFRHPGVDSALTLNEIYAGLRFVVYKPGQEVVHRGSFTGEPNYNEDDSRWTAPADIDGEDGQPTEALLWLHDIGVTPGGSGKDWSELVTIAEDVV